MRANVTVVIPTLNREAPLRHTIASVLPELQLGDEMIVVDQSDRHEIETEQLLSSLPANCQVLRRNYKSTTQAKNEGTSRAQNELIVYLDDDVEISEGFIDRHVQAHADPSVAAVFGPSPSPGETLKTEAELDPEYVRQVKAGQAPDFSCSFSYDGKWTRGCNLSVRRSTFEAVGGFDTRFYGNALGEDYEFGWRVSKRGRVVYDPRVSLVHFAAPSGGTRNEVDFSKYLRTFADNKMYLYFSTRGAWPLWPSLEQIVIFSISNQAARYGRNRALGALVTAWNIICATIRAIGLVWLGWKEERPESRSEAAFQKPLVQRRDADVLQVVPTLSEWSGVADYARHLATKLEQDHCLRTCFAIGRAEPAGGGRTGTISLEQTSGALMSAVSAAGLGTAPIVLHYVGYGYQPRGIPFWLLDALQTWRNAVPQGRLLTVFHELYATSTQPWQSSFWLSPVQQYLTKQIARMSDAALTPVEGFAERLLTWNGRLRGHCNVLPVFSNVGEPATVDPPLAREPTLVVFAGPGAAQQLYSRYKPRLVRSLKHLGVERVVDIGARSAPPPARIADKPVIALGLLSANDASAVLSKSRYGLVRYPLRYAGKSGIFAAYAAHGVIPIFVDSGRPTAESAAHGARFVVAEQIDRLLSDEELLRFSAAGTDWYRSHSTRVHAGVVADWIGELALGQIE